MGVRAEDTSLQPLRQQVRWASSTWWVPFLSRAAVVHASPTSVEAAPEDPPRRDQALPVVAFNR